MTKSRQINILNFLLLCVIVPGEHEYLSTGGILLTGLGVAAGTVLTSVLGFGVSFEANVFFKE